MSAGKREKHHVVVYSKYNSVFKRIFTQSVIPNYLLDCFFSLLLFLLRVFNLQAMSPAQDTLKEEEYHAKMLVKRIDRSS